MANLAESRASSANRENRNHKLSSDSEVPIRCEETELIGRRMKEIIGVASNRSFASKAGLSDALLGAYLRSEKLPGVKHLVAIANTGGVLVDWLATGRGPRTRAELQALEAAAHQASAQQAPADLDPEAAELLARYARCTTDQRRAINTLLDAILTPTFRAWLKVGEYINELATQIDRPKK